jgi:hypothetical protein
MRTALKLECIGGRIPGIPSRAWVKKGYIKVTSVSAHPEWEFIRANTWDYSEANSVGTRGVYKYYWLEDGEVYEVSEPWSWGKTLHYFCVVINGEIRKVSKEVAESCLSLPLE